MSNRGSLSVLVLLCFLQAQALARGHNSTGDVLAKTKSGRLLSLFSVVTFQNDQCTGSSSTSSNRVMGTCLSASECAGKGNSNVDGSCASGFGVCCIIAISGCTNTVSENCTYVQNDGYPSAVTTTSTTCTTTINRPSSGKLCQIRLDFENFQTSVASTGACGTAADSFTVTAPFSSSALAFPPTLCGTLTGQHMYFESGDNGDPTFSIITGTGAANRLWRIKVTHIECGNKLRAPSGCDQFFTGPSGIVESYGFSTQEIQSMRSNYCVRQESGYCSIQWTVNPGVADGFLVSSPTTESETVLATCTDASVTIGSTLVCGGIFSSIDADTADAAIVSTDVPFVVRHSSFTNTLANSIGFSLVYNQIPC